MKILVAGAGIGGLYAAYLLGKQGHSVTLYERAESLDVMRYDWHDDVNPFDMAELGLELPKESFPKKDWTFLSPGEELFSMDQREEYRDYSMERRPFNRYLYNLASQYAEIVFGRAVTGAYIEDNRIAGLTFSDGVEKCDLVVDSCGVDSVVRKSLADTFMVDREAGDSVFVVYRAFFDAVEGVIAEYSNKVYLKHRGNEGISWCIVDNDPTQINVLVGKVGSITEEYIEDTLEALRYSDPILGREVKRGGIICRIPVRRPLNVFIADGYAAVGDSACMTVPLIGSGIITSLQATKILSDVLAKDPSSDATNLWEYQKGVYEKFGAEHCGVDCMKNWLLSAKNEFIDLVFKKGVLSNEDLQRVSIGKMPVLTAKSILTKIKRIGLLRVYKLVPMALMLSRANRAVKVARKIPKEYDVAKIAKWANEMDR